MIKFYYYFYLSVVAARNAGPNSPNNVNSTLNRPMASQGGTRYEDRTMTRPHAGPSGYRTGRVSISISISGETNKHRIKEFFNNEKRLVT